MMMNKAALVLLTLAVCASTAFGGQLVRTFDILISGNTTAQVADVNAVGMFHMDVFKPTQQFYSLLFKFQTFNLTKPLPPLAQHIHQGNSNAIGPVVLVFPGVWIQQGNTPEWTLEGAILNTDLQKNAFNQTYTQVINDVMNNAGNFYINVHTQTWPNGALRGQMNA